MRKDEEDGRFEKKVQQTTVPLNDVFGRKLP